MENVHSKLGTLYPYRDAEGEDSVKYMGGKLNSFGGLDHEFLQVLKSAAGFYIGDLKKDPEMNNVLMPWSRDSQYYWETREEAEKALIAYDYPRKF